MSIGRFFSTSIFISLNSSEFCAKWIYGVELEDGMIDPVLTLDRYILIWGVTLLMVTIYIAAFVPETDLEI